MMCSMRNITGQRIQQARKQQHLTQADLATKLQIAGLAHTRNTIAKIEAGIRQVSDVELAALARALDVRVGWFFEDSDDDANPENARA